MHKIYFKNNGLDNLLLDHKELPHVLAVDVHLLNFVGWIGWIKGIKVIKNNVIIVSAPVQKIGFLRFLDLVRIFEPGLVDCWDGGLGLGLDNI